MLVTLFSFLYSKIALSITACTVLCPAENSRLSTFPIDPTHPSIPDVTFGFCIRLVENNNPSVLFGLNTCRVIALVVVTPASFCIVQVSVPACIKSIGSIL